MSPLESPALAYYASFENEHEEWARVADAAERLVQTALQDDNFDLHLIAARAKSPHSLLQKLRRKNYADPESDLTDRVGVRVITYYESDVDSVVARLKAEFTIDDGRSEDKRIELSLREFGYRSVHLLARASLSGLEDRYTARLGTTWFEIQVRSILEHAWAEIEHELVYKAEIEHDEGFRRDFATLAANLELVDGKFEQLRGERHRLIATYAQEYAEGQGVEASLDSARVLGLLEAYFPNGRSFRQAETEGRPFPPRVEAVCVRALLQVGITTSDELVAHIESDACHRVCGDYASREGLATDELSHLAVLTIAIATRAPDKFAEQFPDLSSDPVLADLLS